MLNYGNQLYWDEIWESKFQLLLKYRDEYGTVLVPNRFYNYEIPEWERKLASWVCTQRQVYRKGKMKQWRYEKLVSVGFDFDPFETRFEKHFQDFLKFKEKYGHTLVPQDYNEFPSLGLWVCHIRCKEITGERRKRLDEEGFVWDTIDYFWEKMFNELILYKKKHGHFKVSERHQGYKQLGLWVVRMRKAKRHGMCQNLSEKQIALLDSIGFTWEPEVHKWEANLEKLKKFKSEYGHCLVPIRRCKIEGLGWWVYWLRKSKDKLTKEEIEEIDSLGFEWVSDFAYRKRNNIKMKDSNEKQA